MKWTSILLCAVLAGTCFGAATLEFSPAGGSTPGIWNYNGSGTLSFPGTINIDRTLGTTVGPLVLVDALVVLPSLTVGNLPNGVGTPAVYSLIPLEGGTVMITDSTGATIYMTGTLGAGSLHPLGAGARAYPYYQAEITNVTVSQAGKDLNSPALQDIIASTGTLDFDLSLSIAGQDFQSMLKANRPESGSFGGSMNVIGNIVPVPGAFLLSAIGVGCLSLIKRRRVS